MPVVKVMPYAHHRQDLSLFLACLYARHVLSWVAVAWHDSRDAISESALI